MTVQRIAVLGAGNGGCAAAADLGARGFEFRLYNRSRERLAPLLERGGLERHGGVTSGSSSSSTCRGVGPPAWSRRRKSAVRTRWMCLRDS